MIRTFFEFVDYKELLQWKVENLPKRGYGMGRKIAQAANCNSTYVSQVLKGSAHFSVEQALAVTQVLGFDEAETAYFVDLVHLNRASTTPLKQFYEKRLQKIRTSQSRLKNRLDYQESLGKEDQARFFSAWHYAAVQLLVGIEKYSTRKTLLDKTGFSRRKLESILRFLKDRGLVTEGNEQLRPGITRIHIGDDHAMLAKHHTNWRMQAIAHLDDFLESPQAEKNRELHYSSAISASLDDAPKIRAVLIEAIERIREIVKDSRQEELFYYGLDFFRPFSKADIGE